MLAGVWLLGTRDDLSVCLDLRYEVFCDEQGFPREIERDHLDGRSLHVAILEEGACVATGRLTPLNHGVYRIGRLAVKKTRRGKGYGGMALRMLMARALDAGAEKLVLGAQLHAQDMYAHFGFAPDGEVYLEAGRPHRKMTATRQTARFPKKCGAPPAKSKE